MNKNNPACYECPKGKAGVHTWKRNEDGTAACMKCGKLLTKEQADDVWREC